MHPSNNPQIHLSNNPDIHPFIQPSMNPPIPLTIHHPFRHPSIHPTVHPFIQQSMHLSHNSCSMHPKSHASVRSSNHPCIHLSIHASIHSSSSPSIHSSNYPSIHPFNNPQIHLFINQSRHPSIQKFMHHPFKNPRTHSLIQWPKRCPFIRSNNPYIHPPISPSICLSRPVVLRRVGREGSLSSNALCHSNDSPSVTLDDSALDSCDKAFSPLIWPRCAAASMRLTITHAQQVTTGKAEPKSLIGGRHLGCKNKRTIFSLQHPHKGVKDTTGTSMVRISQTVL